MNLQAPPVPSSPRRTRPASSRRLATASLIGLLVGAATAFCVGAPRYRAAAIVQVPDAEASTRIATVNGTVIAAVSKPVMTRAAASLVGAGVPVPDADLRERLSLALGGFGAGPGRAGRLARILSATVVARAGTVPGTVELSATLPQAEQASLVATGVAEAFVAEEAEVAAQARHRDELAAAARFEVLRAAASAAHARLSALGGDDPEPAATPAATDGAELTAALTRRDAITRIIASGSPPLGEGKGMPAAVDALQTVYLDQVRQLAKARETLGERHTTVVSLTEAVGRGAAALTAEWRRLKGTADAEVAAARARRDADRLTTPAPADGVRQAALAEARGAVRRADAALARADAADMAEPQPYRVIVRAPVPTAAAAGIPAAGRLPLALLAGLAAAACWMRIACRAPPRSAGAVVEPAAKIEPVKIKPVKIEPVKIEAIKVEPVATPPVTVGPARMAPSTKIEPVAAIEPGEPPVASRAGPDAVITLDASRELAELQAAIAALSPPSERTLDMPFLPPASQPLDKDALREAMRDVLPELAAVEPRPGTPPTVVVAANEIGVATTDVALALGHVAAAVGYRVLVIEGPRPRADLATAADPAVDPILVDLSGGLRVALRAEGSAGVLFLAPCFTDGPRIAAALARRGETPFVDDVADEFDLVVIDGGRAAGCAAADWDADLALRVARFASARDDERFVGTLGLTPDAFLGTMAGATFVPRIAPLAPAAEVPAPAERAAEPGLRAATARPDAGRQPARPHQAPPALPSDLPSHLRPFQPRPSQTSYVTARRRVGLR